VPFKGSSHMLESCFADYKPSNAAFIPARHHTVSPQQVHSPSPVHMLSSPASPLRPLQRHHSRSSQQAHPPSPVHTLSSPASPLRPLQREEFLAKLPKVSLGQVWAHGAICLDRASQCILFPQLLSIDSPDESSRQEM